ncbi:MAG: argininosuccinate synthase [Leptotrichiaceae bacterium]|nr:argininosuccinate synthase [Leptotrichiaceae bacterium]
MKDKVVLAYSGGLDTSIIIPWLKENYDFEVIACCVDVGQDENMEEIRKKAVESGASKIYVEDKKDEFVRNYAFRALRAGAVYEDKYLLGTSFARPLIAEVLVNIAHKEKAKYICHGCTGKGNDQVRFETGIFSLDPTIKIIAPWRMWDISSRESAIDYAQRFDIKLTVTKEKIYSRDQNLWHISHEGGDIEQLENEHNEDVVYMMVTPPEKAKNDPTYVDITFEEGWPVKVDGEALSPVDLLKKLNKIAGENGVGVIDIVENRLVGMKSRGVYETPGGTLLIEALSDLESVIFDKDTYELKKIIAGKYADITYSGQWFTPLREAMDAFVDSVEKKVSGTIKLKLYKGNIKIAARITENALYDETISSFGASELYNHKDAEGFIKLFSLPNKIRAYKKLNKKKN